jgi:hypothetical protein
VSVIQNIEKVFAGTCVAGAPTVLEAEPVATSVCVVVTVAVVTAVEVM